jgi:alanine dehydrogenase
MDIGIPKEARDLDVRVSLGVSAVAQLVQSGHKIYVEQGAGLGAGFPDEHYVQAGATIVYSPEEVYKRAHLVCKVTTPQLEEIEEMEPGQIVCSFAHLAAASSQRFQKLLDKKVSMVALELLRDAQGDMPILRTMSVIGGRLVPQIAARLLQSPGGKGLLLSGIPGLPPAEVCVLGGGEVGFNAARAFAGLGAQVSVLDLPTRLADLDRIFDVPGRIRLMYAYPEQVAKAVAFCDVLVGAVRLEGQRTPVLVSEELVKSMRPGGVIVDVAIDQGGCVDTSRPTSLRDPSFIKHGVIHYCVPNFTALVARTASRALSSVLRPFVSRLAIGPEMLRADPELRSAVVLHQGQVVHPQVAAAHGVKPAKLEEVA